MNDENNKQNKEKQKTSKSWWKKLLGLNPTYKLLILLFILVTLSSSIYIFIEYERDKEKYGSHIDTLINNKVVNDENYHFLDLDYDNYILVSNTKNIYNFYKYNKKTQEFNKFSQIELYGNYCFFVYKNLLVLLNFNVPQDSKIINLSNTKISKIKFDIPKIRKSENIYYINNNRNIVEFLDDNNNLIQIENLKVSIQYLNSQNKNSKLYRFNNGYFLYGGKNKTKQEDNKFIEYYKRSDNNIKKEKEIIIPNNIKNPILAIALIFQNNDTSNMEERIFIADKNKNNSLYIFDYNLMELKELEYPNELKNSEIIIPDSSYISTRYLFFLKESDLYLATINPAKENIEFMTKLKIFGSDFYIFETDMFIKQYIIFALEKDFKQNKIYVLKNKGN